MAKPAPNKLLDVRREQRLCYGVVFLPLRGLVAVPAHVNAAVGRFPLILEAIIYKAMS